MPTKKKAAKAAPKKARRGDEIELFYVSDRTGEFELSRREFESRVAEDLTIPKRSVRPFVAAMLAGKPYTEDLPEDTSAEDRRWWAAAERRFDDMMDAHWAISDRVEAEEAEAREAEEKHGRALAVLPAKGFATSLVLQDGFLGMTQQALGDKFIVSDHGLRPAPGVTVTDLEIMDAVAKLANATEGLNNIRGTTLWQLGDAVVLAETLDKGAEMVAQVIELTGNQKHTVTQAARLCAHFEEKDRMPTLTFTHHQEIFNYRERIPAGVMKRILAKVLKGEERTVVSEDGRETKQNRPLSCGKMRDMFKEYLDSRKGSVDEKDAKEQREEAEAEYSAEPEPAKGNLYVMEDYTVLFSEEFHRGAYEECAVHIDLDEMTANGEEIPFVDGEEEGADADEEEEESEEEEGGEEEEEEDNEEIPE